MFGWLNRKEDPQSRNNLFALVVNGIPRLAKYSIANADANVLLKEAISNIVLGSTLSLSFALPKDNVCMLSPPLRDKATDAPWTLYFCRNFSMSVKTVSNGSLVIRLRVISNSAILAFCNSVSNELLIRCCIIDNKSLPLFPFADTRNFTPNFFKY